MTTCPTCGSRASRDEYVSHRPGREPEVVAVVRCRQSDAHAWVEGQPLPARQEARRQGWRSRTKRA